MSYAFNLFIHEAENDLQTAINETNVNDVMTALMCIDVNEEKINMLQDIICELKSYQIMMMNLIVTHVNFEFNNENRSQLMISFWENGNLKLQNSYFNLKFFLNAFSALFLYDIDEHFS